jgi:hypothetical protein
MARWTDDCDGSDADDRSARDEEERICQAVCGVARWPGQGSAARSLRAWGGEGSEK